MNINFKDAKKVREDKYSSTFRLRNGSELRVAHDSLAPEHVKKIKVLPLAGKNYTKGGLVKHYDEGGETDSSNDSTPAPFIPGQNYSNAPLPGDQNSTSDNSQTSVPSGSDELEAINNSLALTHPTNPNAPTVSNLVFPNKASAESTSPIPQEEQSAQPVQQNQGVSVTGPQTAVPNAGNNIAVQGYQQGLKGIQEQESVDAQIAAQRADLDKQRIQDQEDLKQQTQDNFNNFQAQQQNFMNDYANGHIDPKHYVESMSTGQKVATAIGLFLGGWSSGYTHQGNPALDFLNKQIDRDIQSQQANLDQKKTLLGANQALYHDSLLANNATRAQMNDIYATQIQQAADKLGTPQAKAKADAVSAQFKLQNAQLLQTSALRQSAFQRLQSGSGDPSSLVPILIQNPEEQKQALKEIGDAQTVTRSKNDILNSFDKASSDVRFTTGGHPLYSTFVTPPSIKSLNAYIDPLIHDADGRVNEFEQKDVRGLLPQAFDDDSTVATKRQGLINFINRKAQAPTAKAYGIDINNFPSTQVNPSAGQAGRYQVGQVLNSKQYGKIQIIDNKGNFRQVQ